MNCAVQKTVCFTNDTLIVHGMASIERFPK